MQWSVVNRCVCWQTNRHTHCVGVTETMCRTLFLLPNQNTHGHTHSSSGYNDTHTTRQRERMRKRETGGQVSERTQSALRGLDESTSLWTRGSDYVASMLTHNITHAEPAQNNTNGWQFSLSGLTWLPCITAPPRSAPLKEKERWMDGETEDGEDRGIPKQMKTTVWRMSDRC